jgi:chorismate synthase
LATIRDALPSVDLITKDPAPASIERTDTVPVVAAGVVGEAMVALVLADAVLDKFGGDSVGETKANLGTYARGLRDY